MKATDIEVGAFYHDGKDAVREVISIAPDGAGIERVEYRILAAKMTQEYRHADKQTVPLIGTTTSCHLASFAGWAKAKLSRAECDALLVRLAVRKVKLSPGELAFMESALDEAGGTITPGMEISFNHTEGRAVGGLERKGLVVRQKHEVEVTSLGAAWFDSALRARLAN